MTASERLSLANNQEDAMREKTTLNYSYGHNKFYVRAFQA